MAESKQVPLNGAYYGPPVPPRNSYHSVGRRSSGCGPCCLLCSLFKFLISILIALGIVAFVLWLVFRPNKLQVHVESASLTQFSLANGTNALNYNLTLDISIRNPNKRISLYYDYIEARAIYDGSRFGFETLAPFYQGHKNTTDLHPGFQGQAVAVGSVGSTFNREKGEGFFYVEVMIYTKVRVKVNVFKIGHFKPKIDCVVKLPVPSNKGSAGSFERTKCDIDLF